MIEHEFDFEIFWFWPQEIEFSLNKIFNGFLSNLTMNWIMNVQLEIQSLL
jgi:hypothetical protein